jgi:hypothetical protein
MAALMQSKSYKAYPFVDKLNGFTHHFSDNGLFGINIEGAGSHSS